MKKYCLKNSYLDLSDAKRQKVIERFDVRDVGAFMHNDFVVDRNPEVALLVKASIACVNMRG